MTIRSVSRPRADGEPGAPEPTPTDAAPPVAEGPVRAISVAILAMGGEGGGVLADWVVDLGESNGFMAQATSVQAAP